MITIIIIILDNINNDYHNSKIIITIILRIIMI